MDATLRPKVTVPDAQFHGSARAAALESLSRAVESFPDLPLGDEPGRGLPPADAALAHAIDQAVRRRWLTLESIIQSRLQRPFAELEAPLAAALLAGAAQLVLLDRLPAHAVVNETVAWTRQRLRPGAGSFANAVLRRIAELVATAERRPMTDTGRLREPGLDEIPLADGTAMRLGVELFDGDEVRVLAHQTSHAPFLVRRWIEQFGRAHALAILLHDIVVPPITIIGLPADSPIDKVLVEGTIPHESGRGHVLDLRGAQGVRTSIRAFLDAHPSARVQDIVSAMPVEATRSLQPRLVIDLCAGRGTKTRQLAGTHPGARIVASDVDEERYRALREVFRGHARVEVKSPAEVSRMRGAADLVLADVPCSNTGVLARRLEARYRIDATRLDELSRIQRRILSKAAELTRAGGYILYSTCSIEPEENVQQSAWAVATLGVRLESDHASLPAGIPGDPPSRYTDGGYYALLRRPPKSTKPSRASRSSRPPIG